MFLTNKVYNSNAFKYKYRRWKKIKLSNIEEEVVINNLNTFPYIIILSFTKKNY